MQRNKQRSKIKDEAKWGEIGLQRTLDPTDFSKVTQISQEHAEKTFLHVREKQREKFARMSERATKVTEREKVKRIGQVISKEKWVLNFSTHELTEAERKALERGLNFSDCPSKIPRENIIAGVESALQKCKDKQGAEKARGAIASVLATAKPPKQTATKEERKAIQALRQNKNIVILPADKGKATVVLDKVEYDQKKSAGTFGGASIPKKSKKTPQSVMRAESTTD